MSTPNLPSNNEIQSDLFVIEDLQRDARAIDPYDPAEIVISSEDYFDLVGAAGRLGLVGQAFMGGVLPTTQRDLKQTKAENADLQQNLDDKTQEVAKLSAENDRLSLALEEAEAHLELLVEELKVLTGGKFDKELAYAIEQLSHALGKQRPSNINFRPGWEKPLTALEEVHKNIQGSLDRLAGMSESVNAFIQKNQTDETE